ncbi:MAG: HDOD domain-containing protein [Zoogloeaceae bacterium]|jgi:putative nucleotidyltransferase with HDIG domain|nr:HDOD domain-containing protein [Zoogloeaceae bacterium]
MHPPFKLADIPESIVRLPAFPGVITELLNDLDDDNSSMLALARHVERDPVVTGRILSAANRMLRYEGWSEVRDVYTAVSLIGFARIREIVLTTCIVSFTGVFCSKRFYWGHSLAVGIGARELAAMVNVDPNTALVTGLLHDVGQLWMSYFHPLEFQQTRLLVEVHGREVCAAEREHFGFDHCQVGEIVARHWGLPEDVIVSIANHHTPDEQAAKNKLVAITGMAERIANALDLPCRDINRVDNLSPAILHTLDLDWTQDHSDLLGAIDARYQYAAMVFT